MPKLWILSDLHLETIPYPYSFAPKRPDFDILVAAGDIWESDFQRGLEFLRRMAGHSPVVFVPGNHEFWNDTIPSGMKKARHQAKKFDITMPIDAPAVIKGCTFVGAALWSDYEQCEDALDHSRPTGERVFIKDGASFHPITPTDLRQLHNKDLKSVEEGIAAFNPDKPLVVVTHHAPHPESLPEAIRGSWAAGNSASDLSHLTDTGRASLWIHGHIHASCDFIRPGGTRIVCNPAGNGFSNSAFNEGLVIEV